MIHTAGKHLTQSKALLGKFHLCLKEFLLLHWRKKEEWGKKNETYFPFRMQKSSECKAAHPIVFLPAISLISKPADLDQNPCTEKQTVQHEPLNRHSECMCSELQIGWHRCRSRGNGCCDICTPCCINQQAGSMSQGHTFSRNHPMLSVCSVPSPSSK